MLRFSFQVRGWVREGARAIAMGNCLKGQAADDVSLLRGGEGTRESSSSDQIHADIYQVSLNVPACNTSFMFVCDLQSFQRNLSKMIESQLKE